MVTGCASPDRDIPGSLGYSIVIRQTRGINKTTTRQLLTNTLELVSWAASPIT